MAVTLKDVAKAAGVSRSTAARAFDDAASIGAETLARVRRVADELGYTKNVIARGLRTRRSGLVGVVLKDLVSTVSQGVLDAAQRSLEKSGYNVVICLTHDDPTREAAYLSTLLQQQAEGLIIASTGENAEQLAALRERMPVVSVLRDARLPGIASVLADDVDSARQATTYLLELGHRRIGIIAGPSSTTSGREREVGFALALADAGLTPSDDLLWRGPHSPSSGADGLTALLDASPPPSAVLVANSEAVYGVLTVLSKRGISIPSELSLICYEDPPLFEYWNPSLTVVDPQGREIGARAAAWLVDRIRRSDETAGVAEVDTTAAEVLRSPSRLILRASCGPHPRENGRR